jgi:hypothetical protein
MEHLRQVLRHRFALADAAAPKHQFSFSLSNPSFRLAFSERSRVPPQPVVAVAESVTINPRSWGHENVATYRGPPGL